MNTPEQQNPNIPPPDDFEEDTISITNIMLTLARQIKIIIITPTILCTLTIIYVMFFAKPIYKSTSKIMYSSSSGGMTQAVGLAAQFGIAIPTGQPEPKWVYPEIIKSRTLARAMLKRKFDTEKYGPQKPLLQILTYGDDAPTFSLDTLIKIGVNDVIDIVEDDKYEDDVLVENKLIYNYADLYELTVAQLLPLERMAQKSAENLVAGVAASKAIPFERVLFALGIRYVGETVAKKLAKHFKSIDALQAANFEQLIAVDEIGDRIAQSVIEFFSSEENIHTVNRLKDFGVQLQLSEAALANQTDVLAGNIFVVSPILVFPAIFT